MIYYGPENRTCQTGRVIGDLYSPYSFDTRLGEWASGRVLMTNPALTAKLTMSAKLNYLPSCSQVQPNKLHSVNQQVMDYEIE